MKNKNTQFAALVVAVAISSITAYYITKKTNEARQRKAEQEAGE